MASGGSSNCLCDGWKSLTHNTTKAFLGAVVSSGKAPQPFNAGPLDSKRFIVAFCGSGTGHLTQALAVVRAQQKAGMTLAGVVTDTDASKKMLDEMIAPLGVSRAAAAARPRVARAPFAPRGACKRDLGGRAHALETAQVEVLILPAIKIVDAKTGMVPIPFVAHNILTVQVRSRPAACRTGFPAAIAPRMSRRTARSHTLFWACAGPAQGA